MQYLPLTQDKFAIVDDEDFDLVNQWKWQVTWSGSQFYAVRTIAYENRVRTRYLHHEVLGLPPANNRKWVVDHINRNPLDCRKENLRVCTQYQNLANVAPKPIKNKYSNYKCVTFDRNKKRWVAKIQHGRKKKFCGCFKTEYEAVVAYNRDIVKIAGSYAYVNPWKGPTLPPAPGTEDSLRLYYQNRRYNPYAPRKPKLPLRQLPPGIQLYFDFYYEPETKEKISEGPSLW
jgi:HNH endonuclease